MKDLQSTTDIWFSAFLLYKGFEVTKLDKLSRGKAKLYFQLSSEKWDELKLEFNHSEFIKFKALVNQVKDLGY